MAIPSRVLRVFASSAAITLTLASIQPMSLSSRKWRRTWRFILTHALERRASDALHQSGSGNAGVLAATGRCLRDLQFSEIALSWFHGWGSQTLQQPLPA